MKNSKLYYKQLNDTVGLLVLNFFCCKKFPKKQPGVKIEFLLPLFSSRNSLKRTVSLQVLFRFHFPHSYFAYNFLVVEKSTPHPKPAVLWCYTLKGQAQKSIIRGSNFKGHQPPFCISVNLTDTFKTQMKQKNHSFCVTISRREKDGWMYLIIVDMSFN